MTDEYVRVGTTLYKIVFQPLINGTFAKRRVPWSMGTLRYDHGKDFIAVFLNTMVSVQFQVT